MPRAARVAAGGVVYHVLNRGNGRLAVFSCDADYALFQSVLAQAQQRVPMRLIGYCLMPNHWHMVLWPHADGELSEFMRWLTVTHTQRWHAARGTAGTGHLYQGRFKSFPVQQNRPPAAMRSMGLLEGGDAVLSVLRYVERNPVRAGLATCAELWPWGSGQTRRKSADGLPVVSAPPHGLPEDWRRWVNRPDNDNELAALRRCIARGAPFGETPWVKQIARDWGLESTLRPRGRPGKAENQKKGS